MNSSITITIKSPWDEKGMQTEDLHPAGSAAVLVTYEEHPPAVEAGMHRAIAEACAQALTSRWVVAGRWFDDQPPQGEARFFPAPRRNILQRKFEQWTHAWSADLLTSRSREVVAQLFQQGWESQSQVILVLDPDDINALNSVLEPLRVWRNWKNFIFPKSAAALIVPGVDGACAVVSAASAETLSEVVAALRESFEAAGFSVFDR